MKRDLKNLNIDLLKETDLKEIIKKFKFPWTSSEATKAKWDAYFFEQKIGRRIVCLARWKDELIGYGSLLKDSKYPYFKASGIPEIHDVWISEEWRDHGFGRQLIGYLEFLAQKEKYQLVGIGVGLYEDYGRAQRLYIQLGYIPDGKGVTYQYHKASPGNSYPLDDDLVIWLIKKLPIISFEKDDYYLERQEEPIQKDEVILFRC